MKSYFSGLNTKREWRAFWEKLSQELPADLLAKALSSLHPTSAQVLAWHYCEGNSFAVIKERLNLSVSTVRNYHSRGLFDLQCFFHGEHAGNTSIQCKNK